MKTQRRTQYFFGQAVLLAACMLITELAAVSPVQASSIIFKPDVITSQVGETFTLPVVVDPAGSWQYTVRFSVAFRPDLLEATSFVFGPNWIAVPQPGYDSLDNRRGELIKTGGFANGFSSPVLFGTVTFRAKGPGDSAIAVGPQSFILDAKNRSTLESRPQARIIAAGGPILEASSIEPLPNLPSGEKNIFDISLTPEQKPTRHSTAFFILLFAIAGFLGIIGQIIFVWVKRRSFMKKIKHDKDIRT